MTSLLQEAHTGFDSVFGAGRGRTTKTVVVPDAAPYARLPFPADHPYLSTNESSWRVNNHADYTFYYSPARGCVFTLELEEFDEEEMSNWGDDAHEFVEFVGGQKTVQAVILEDPRSYSEIAKTKDGLFLVCEQSELLSMEVYSYGESKSFSINVYMLVNILEEASRKALIYNVACNEMPEAITAETPLYSGIGEKCTFVFDMTQEMVDNYEDYQLEEWEIEQRRALLTEGINCGHKFTFSHISFSYDSRYAHHVITDAGEKVWAVTGKMGCRINLTMLDGDIFTFDCTIADLKLPALTWTKEIGHRTLSAKQFMKEWK